MNNRFYPYATDSNERDVLPYYFAATSVIVVYLMSLVIVALGISIPWWLALPTPMAIYIGIHAIFSNQIWKWGPLHRWGVVRIPNLNGAYKGFLWSSHDEHAERHACELSVCQTWTSISIRGRFAQSRSYNMVSGISVEGTDAPRLTYEYWNEPSSGAPAPMVPHRGTVWLDIRVADTQTELDGEYYTGRGRATSGRIMVRSVR
jgi:hypothetical protein